MPRRLALLLLPVALPLLWLLRAGPPAPPAAATSASVAQARAAPPVEIPPEHMPPPFGERHIRLPDPAQPAPPPDASFCDDASWTRVPVRAADAAPGDFAIDRATWERSLAATRAGIASFVSICRSGGGPVRIVAADGGDLLARYDGATGLSEP